jgi:hypothetical protein
MDRDPPTATSSRSSIIARRMDPQPGDSTPVEVDRRQIGGRNRNPRSHSIAALNPGGS